MYSYISLNDDKWLDSIIYGYENEPKPVITVFSNSYGVIYLPKIGYFITDKPTSSFSLVAKNGSYSLFYNDSLQNYMFEPIYKVFDEIELITHPHPLFERPFGDNISALNKENLKKVNSLHFNGIVKGISLLSSCNPEFYTVFKKAVKKIMLFNADMPNSFAVLSAHNMIFLNVNDWDNELYFVDHFSHEGSHVIFNTLTYFSKIKLFKVPFTTPFALASGKPEEHSTVYLRFHGLFTFVEIIKSLIGIIKNGNLSDITILEGKGRLAFQLKRFKNSLKSFEGLDIFQEEGAYYYKFFLNQYEKFYKEYGYITTIYDLADQSYDFNSEIFLQLNPLNNA